jgi:uncharacterized protein
MRKLIYLLLVVSAGGIASAKFHAETLSPSFDCEATESVVERMICSDPKLSAEDRLMVRLYGLARVSAFGRGPSNQAAAQRQWLKDRDSCAAPLADLADASNRTTKCLTQQYADRIERLALALLFSNPDIALPELRRIDPTAADMFEAVYLYARSSRLSGVERQRIVALLEPYAAKESDAGSIGEPNASDAVKSDAAFAEFIGVRSAFLNDMPADGRAFPCAAVVRKPRLLEATGPRFGSTMDSFIIQSDCPDTLPPLPKFSRLVEKRRIGLTDCGGGSIRHAYYSAFWNASLAARLATGAQLRRKRLMPFPRRKNVTAVDTSAALQELIAYYVRFGRAITAQARPLAHLMIYNVLEEAWQC